MYGVLYTIVAQRGPKNSVPIRREGIAESLT